MKKWGNSLILLKMAQGVWPKIKNKEEHSK
jgi:hypothetical protein